MLYAETMGNALTELFDLACEACDRDIEEYWERTDSWDEAYHVDWQPDDPFIVKALTELSLVVQVYEAQLRDVATKYGFKRSN
jgi:hypothetical protein